MAKITVSADLFRRTALCQSTEETRYYLKGVYVDPCADGGALLVATDGRTMIVLRDVQARIDGAPEGESSGWIVSADKGALKAMKDAKPYGGMRLVQIDGERLTVIHRFPDQPDLILYIQAAPCLVCGTYPDWRRVVPRKADKRSPASFDVRLLASLAEALGDGGKSQPIALFGEDDSSPALAYGNGNLDGFGIAMPVRHHRDSPPPLPAWMA